MNNKKLTAQQIVSKLSARELSIIKAVAAHTAHKTLFEKAVEQANQIENNELINASKVAPKFSEFRNNKFLKLLMKESQFTSIEATFNVIDVEKPDSLWLYMTTLLTFMNKCLNCSSSSSSMILIDKNPKVLSFMHQKYKEKHPKQFAEYQHFRRRTKRMRNFAVTREE